jgi:hypothetical protein
VGENEQPGTGNLPDLPAAPPAGVDPETFRQYQEFQRFQEFQRYTNAPPQAGAPWTAEGGNLEPRPDVHEQLTGVRHQLQKIQDSQAKIEKVTNPPLWRKILRGTPFRWAVGILILIVLAVWGVPALVEHYFGSDAAAHTNGAGKPDTPGDSGQLPTGPYDAVVDVYRLPAEGFAPSRTCFIFSAAAKKSFAQAFDVPTCEAAITKIASQITDRDAYAEPDLTRLPVPAGTTITVSSCDFTVTGGPRLGAFTVTKQEQGWEITGYEGPLPCPATTPPTGPTTGSAQTTTPTGPATEPAIPTGDFSGIPVH